MTENGKKKKCLYIVLGLTRKLRVRGKKCVLGIAHPFTVSGGHGSLRLDENVRLLGLCRTLVAVLGLRGRESSAARADLDPLARQ